MRDPRSLPEGARLAPGIHKHGASLRAYYNISFRAAGLGLASRRFFKRFPLSTPLDEIQRWQQESKQAMKAEINNGSGRRRARLPISDEVGKVRAAAERLAIALADLERHARVLELRVAEARR